MTEPLRQRIFLDPDGTWSGWLLVVIEAPTGIIYQNQCGGVANDEREVEGYVVPIGGEKFEMDGQPLDSAQLTAVFHRGWICESPASGTVLPNDKLTRLKEVVGTIPIWMCSGNPLGDTKSRLRVDESRLSEVTEGWVPVLTPYGAGILMWKNCD